MHSHKGPCGGLWRARLGDFLFSYRFFYPETAGYLSGILTGQETACEGPCVAVDTRDLALWEEKEGKAGPFAEFCLACMPTSELLLGHDACIFHAAALRRKDRAWLIAAGSGVGKTTHCRSLLSLWPEEFSVINGDKPLLKACPDGRVMVCPSPWNGKEFWGGMEKAILRGIIILDQGKENVMRRLIPDQALLPIMQQFLYMTADETGIRVMCRLADAMLTNTPVFAYVNKGDDQSSIKLDTLIRKLECESNEVFNSAANPAGEGSRTISADCLW